MEGVEGKKEALKKLEKERLRLLGQLDDLSQESAEHKLVLRTLESLPDDRRCYRIVGRVAVERTVAEVRPALTTYAQKVDELHKTYNEQLNFINEEVSKITRSLGTAADAP
ncbi:KE2 family protein, putative [Babesia bigemina]|uniref:KE2 family protein, putative n=1 Tax=Babesia bigemina TaxID=5866 RepID=A0A061D2V6_BABBI|nr:KE2 family protein, putative [Babesia bigemina]CDR94943.1 KE2 family protein, putative [Babesia bigemina]|eukprot:XP_012767129.1 KE2 family protein, putative [Babesia bigemina]